MGMLRYTYVGPYVSVPKTFTTINREVRGCSQHKAVYDSSYFKFCPQCGSPLSNFSIETTVEAHKPKEIGRLCNDSLVSPLLDDKNQIVWIPNNKYGVNTREFVSQDYVFPVDSSLIDKELSLFLLSFSSELEILKNNYKEVTPLWGLISYYM